MDLVIKKGDTIPVRGMTSEMRASKIEKELYPFLQALLSLDNSEKNVDRLPSILLMIEKSAYSMTFQQVKDAFVKYVNHELPGLKPKSNYLDGVLFASVINAYKQSKPKEKKEEVKVEISQEEKDQNEYLNIVYSFDDFISKGKVEYNYHTAYDSLKAKKLVPVVSREQSEEIFGLAKSRLINESITNRDLKSALKQVRNTPLEKKWLIDYGKCILLEKYYKNLHKKKTHIKDLL